MRLLFITVVSFSFLLASACSDDTQPTSTADAKGPDAKKGDSKISTDVSSSDAKVADKNTSTGDQKTGFDFKGADAGGLETKIYALSGFDKINIAAPFAFTITQNASYSIQITLNKELVSKLDVKVNADVLSIGFTEAITFSNPTLTALISLPALSGLKASGAAHGSFSGFASSALELEANGSGQIEGTAGSASSLSLKASGASTLQLTNITGAASVDVAISGASNGTVTVVDNGTLSGTVSGASHLTYSGTNVTVTATADISSSITHQ